MSRCLDSTDPDDCSICSRSISWRVSMSAMAVRVLCMLKRTSVEDHAGFAGAERSSESVRAYEVKLKGITISGATRNQAGQALIAMSMSPSLTRTACTIAARAFEAVALDGERGFE